MPKCDTLKTQAKIVFNAELAKDTEILRFDGQTQTRPLKGMIFCYVGSVEADWTPGPPLSGPSVVERTCFSLPHWGQ